MPVTTSPVASAMTDAPSGETSWMTDAPPPLAESCTIEPAEASETPLAPPSAACHPPAGSKETLPVVNVAPSAMMEGDAPTFPKASTVPWLESRSAA